MNRPPPPSQTRLLSRFRSAFFATPGCALLTLLSLAVLWLMAESLTRWLIIDAVFGGEDREACASGGGMWHGPASRGNCRRQNRVMDIRQISGGGTMAGGYGICIIGICIIAGCNGRLSQNRRLRFSALLPAAVCMLYYAAADFGLPEVATQLWGGVM